MFLQNIGIFLRRFGLVAQKPLNTSAVCFPRNVAAHQTARCHQQMTKLWLFFGVRSSQLIDLSLLCIVRVMVLMMMIMIIMMMITTENSHTVPLYTVTDYYCKIT